ncbi:MAG: DNA repair protein RecO C-terminal domain-containing protein, partial [Candidatus Magasanikbacteria bacterium]|nr:DNA repair protein RecO C-terminal domain-containing protein [Candidatus Magasanikbacteria bacterium]
QHGGLICSACAIKTKEQNQPISNEAIKVLRYLQHYSLTKSMSLKLNNNLSLEIKNLVENFVNYQI